jgi:hypothetical protein
VTSRRQPTNTRGVELAAYSALVALAVVGGVWVGGWVTILACLLVVAWTLIGLCIPRRSS